MNITDELRKFANDWDWLDHKSYESEQKLMAIADRIDAEYQKMLDERDSEQFNALMDARDKGVNAVLKEPEGFGLIALPKGADDKYIHIGDVMESKGSKLLFDEAPFEVWAIQYDDCGWKVYDHLGNCYSPSLLHHHAQTVENVQAAENEHMLLKAFNIIGEFLEENVKLRKLCADAWHLFTEHGAVNPCDLPMVDAVRDQMRELGVKVD